MSPESSFLSIRLFGRAEICYAGKVVDRFRTTKVQALLIYLAVTGQTHNRATLAGLLWGNATETNARASLRKAVANLRKLLGPCLEITRQTLALPAEKIDWLDVAEFDHLTHDKANLESLKTAVSLYQGNFAEGLYLNDAPEFEQWLVSWREHYHEKIIQILHTLLSHAVHRNLYREGLDYAGRLLTLNPWHEATHRQLMLLQARNGHRAAALAQFQRCRQILAEELDIAPADETIALYEAIQAGKLAERFPVPVQPEINAGYQNWLASLHPATPAFLSQTIGRRPPLFVGRRQALTWLHQHLNDAFAGQGNSPVLLIAGEAGSGKTALLRELTHQAEKAHPDILVTYGQCHAHSGQGSPLLPFHDVLTMLSGDATPQWRMGMLRQSQARRLWQQRTMVVQMLLQYGPALWNSLIDPQATAAGLLENRPQSDKMLAKLWQLSHHQQPQKTEWQQLHLFQQYGHILQMLATHKPLLILLDDLHWADNTSVDLLFHLNKRLRHTPILLIGTYRPAPVRRPQADAPHSLLNFVRESQRDGGNIHFDLDRLAAEEGRTFVAAYLDREANAFDNAFRERLWQQTQGQALFTVELVNDLAARGGISQAADGRWKASEKLDWTAIPVKVKSVIAARLAHLESDERQMLEIAAIEGEQFTAQTIARIQDSAERPLLHRLSRSLMGRHRLIQPLGETAVGGRSLTRYRFSHDLFRQYLYEQLGLGERRLLHNELAQALEQLYGDQAAMIAARLAHHYRQAGNPAQERRYARLAGRQAARRFAHAEAAAFFSRALELTDGDDQDTRFNLLLDREASYDLQGRRQDQAADLDALEKLAAGRAPNQRLEVNLRRLHYSYFTSDFAAATTLARTIIRQANGDPLWEARGEFEWGRALYRQGEYPAAQSHLQQALQLAETADRPDLQIAALGMLGGVTWSQGEMELAQEYCRQALTISHQINDRLAEGNILTNLGLVAAAQGDYEQAALYSRQALAQHRQVGNRQSEGLTLGNLGNVVGEQGLYDQAWNHYQRGLQICREIGDRRTEAITLNNLGYIAGCQDNFAQATPLFKEALALAREIGTHREVWMTLMEWGSMLTRADQPEQAQVLLEEALSLCHRLGNPPLLLISQAELARAQLAAGKTAPAAALVEEILNQLDNQEQLIESEAHPQRIYLACYQVLQAGGDVRAGPLLQTAYEQLRLRAARIGNEATRHSFLENVPWHRDLIRAWKENQTPPRTDSSRSG